MEEQMRKYLVITLLIGLLVFAMTSCGGSPGPKSTVDAFMTAAKANNIVGMKAACTGDMAKLWDMFEEMKKFVPEEEAAEMDFSKELEGETVTIVEKAVEGDTGKVDVTVDENTMTFVCKNVDGKWLIADLEKDGESMLAMIPEMEQMMEMMKNMPEMPVMPDMPDMPEPDMDGDGE